MIRSIKAITITLERELYDFYKNILHYFLRSMLTPMLYLFVIGVGLGSFIYMPDYSSYVQFLIPGILMMATVQVTHNHLSFEVLAARTYEKYLELLTMVAPIHPYEAVIGYILAGVIIAIFNVSVFLIPVYLFLSIELPLITLFIFTVGLGILFSATGFSVGMYFDDPHHLSIFNSIVITAFSFLCGVFFPLSVYPDPLRFIIGLFPLTQAIEGIRGCGNLYLQIIYVWVSAIVAVFIAILIFKKKMII